jgi:hypothetical protein
MFVSPVGSDSRRRQVIAVCSAPTATTLARLGSCSSECRRDVERMAACSPSGNRHAGRHLDSSLQLDVLDLRRVDAGLRMVLWNRTRAPLSRCCQLGACRTRAMRSSHSGCCPMGKLGVRCLRRNGRVGCARAPGVRDTRLVGNPGRCEHEHPAPGS